MADIKTAGPVRMCGRKAVMPKIPRYFVVEAQALPEIFVKVAEAKRLFDTGEVDTVHKAARMVGISRSAFTSTRTPSVPSTICSTGGSSPCRSS
jgi:predicted DNA-binding protein (UPF0251 family)